MKKIVSAFMALSLVFTVFLYFPSPAKASSVVTLSVGKPYTCVRYENPTYPDTDSKELTDGVFASLSYADKAWTGTTRTGIQSGLAYDRWPIYTTVIDLESVCSVTEIYGSFLLSNGVGVGLPRGFRVYASEDNENWMELGYLNNFGGDFENGRYTFGWRNDNGVTDNLCDLVENSDNPIKARYIRYDFEKYTPHNFIDEIVVKGYEGEVSSATELTDLTRLENDEILAVSEETTGGIQDMVLIYNQHGGANWTPEYFKPYVTYLDKSGNSVDTLYDSFLFLALNSPNGRIMDLDNDIVTIDDWNWYLERTFEGENSDVSQLNKALINASNDLGYKVTGNYVVMIPYPTAEAVNFGEINGRSLDLSNEEDAKFAIDYYLDKALSYIENSDYSNLNFKGFYWVHETASRVPLIQYFNNAVDETGYKSYWIPYFTATGYLWPEEMGFDAFTLQPNHFFAETSDDTLGGGGTTIIESTKKLAARGNFGVEFECDYRLSSDVDAFNRGLDYFNAAAKMGFQGEGYFRNWYEGGGALYGFAYSSNTLVRSFYDSTYEVIKGIYKPRKYITSLEGIAKNSILYGKTYTHNGTLWYADRTTDTNSTFLTDGETGGNYGSSNYYGVKDRECPVIEFDLKDEPLNLDEIHINFIQAGVAGIKYPSVRIFYRPSPNSEWRAISASKATDADYVLKLTDTVKTYGLKFEFIADGSFVFIKEIMAFDYKTGVTSDIEVTPSFDKVISVNKPYTKKGYTTPKYPDTGNRELTDGIYAPLSPADDGWTGGRKGYSESGNAYDVWPLYSVEIDLEETFAVSQIYGNFLYDTNPEYQISLPIGVRIYASEDGENWMKLAYISNIKNAAKVRNYTYGWHTSDVHGVMTDLTNNPESAVKARYIRFDADPNNGPFLIDEITVIGSKNITDETLTLTNLTKLEEEGPKRVSEDTGFIRDMALCYQHTGVWDRERFKPLITYVDKDGNSKDMMFDAVLFLSQNNNGKRVYDHNTADLRLSDWTDYIDRIFGEGGDVSELNEAAKQASLDLNDPDFKTKYVVMIPYPAPLATEFGTINDRNIDLSVTDDAKYALSWYMDTVIEKAENGGYDYLDFTGLYWMAEGSSRSDLISFSTSYVREKGYKSYWIPYFNSSGFFWNELLGFDAVTLQPNHFFGDPNENTLGAGGTTVIGTVAKLGGYANFGVEMEMDASLISDLDYYNKGLDYLNAAVEYDFMGPEYYRNWYLGSDMIAQILQSQLPEARNFYDYMYEVMKGTYTPKEYLTEMNRNLLSGLPYTHNITDDSVWYAERSKDTDCTFLTDGLAGGNFYGKDYFGVKKSNATFEFDFEEAMTFKELHINSFYDYSAAVRFPKNLNIYAKNGGEWVMIFSGPVTDKHFAIKFDRLFTAEGLKYEFTIDNNFLFLKEFMAFDYDTDFTADVEVTLPTLSGDVNRDGTVDEADLTLLKRYFAGFDEGVDTEGADVNKSGTITRIDLLLLAKKVG